MSFDLDTYLTDRRALIETELVRVAEADAAEVPATLRKAMTYSLLAGGKRLRPILALAGCEAVGGQLTAALPLGCALEMIHTYSLIHDDLPAMDNDDFRRGRPTNHKVFGEAIAILAGDALLTEAFAVTSRCPAPPAVLVQVLRELASAVGAAGMVGGQVIDIEATGNKVDVELLRRLHGKKTGALLAVSVCAGARLGGADESAVAGLRTYAEALGLAFQIIDDVLDVTADLQTLGKDPGSDREAGKTTYVDLLGVDGARRQADEVMTAGIAALAPLGTAAEPLRALGRYTVERRS
ncbi:MAG TPA: polyprenyl synthetase family protein [Pseudomonadota bacterium]|nr:polyprenyl synthetase family protein [Pseudomonadota bacterium]